jgi:hypothetical protein
MIPLWLHALSIASLLIGAVCFTLIMIDILRHPQRMAIMNLVWPVTALFGGVLVLWFYRAHGRATVQAKRNFALSVATGALHCGSGCTLGDICAEWLVVTAPAVAVAFGWHSLFDHRIFAVWVVDYLFAYAFGIVFQYFSIAPMRGLAFGPGLLAAIKADTLSLTAWQIGMYGFMAIAHFVIFPQGFGAMLHTASPEFWFMMQIAMLCGFATAYPVNWWLIRAGIKEEM